MERLKLLLVEGILQNVVMTQLCSTVLRPLRLNAANMPKCWKIHSLLMATRLWAFMKQSMESSWPG